LKIDFLKLHNISHPGRLASRRIISSRFVWRGLSSNVATRARACLHCQQSKTHHHTHLLPQHMAITKRWFAHLRYITAITSNMFSLSLITPPNGWKLIPCLIFPWWHAHKHQFFLGYPTLGCSK
jgi:hypothetical protein